MNTQNQNVPTLVQNPLNGKYINLMPFFEFINTVATCNDIAKGMEQAIDWLACTPLDPDNIITGEKEIIAYRLIQLKQLFREIGELPTAKQGRE
jgi:hypothetical protein